MKNTITKNIEIVNYAEDTHIDRQVKDFLKVVNSGGVPLETLSKEAARKVLVDAQASVNVDLSGIEVSQKTIAVDGQEISLNIVRPEGITEELPVFIFIHGGGWILGDFPTHERLVRDLVVASGAVAVFVNYTPSPEAQYPVAINQIYSATKWVAENGKSINVDGKRLAIVGNSVGGNMTTVTSLRAIAENGPKISLQVMLWPVTDAVRDWESFDFFGEERFLTTSLMRWMFDQYTTNPEERAQKWISPLAASLDELKDLPPTLIQVAENDILRDQGEAYGRKLNEAGVTVTTIRYNGMIHDFGLLNALANVPSVKSMILHAAAELKKYLFV
jgi:acetyl esterase/lipase